MVDNALSQSAPYNPMEGEAKHGMTSRHVPARGSAEPPPASSKHPDGQNDENVSNGMG
jgi:hypothetical protein